MKSEMQILCFYLVGQICSRMYSCWFSNPVWESSFYRYIIKTWLKFYTHYLQAQFTVYIQVYTIIQVLIFHQFTNFKSHWLTELLKPAKILQTVQPGDDFTELSNVCYHVHPPELQYDQKGKSHPFGRTNFHLDHNEVRPCLTCLHVHWLKLKKWTIQHESTYMVHLL